MCMVISISKKSVRLLEQELASSRAAAARSEEALCTAHAGELAELRAQLSRKTSECFELSDRLRAAEAQVAGFEKQSQRDRMSEPAGDLDVPAADEAEAQVSRLQAALRLIGRELGRK